MARGTCLVSGMSQVPSMMEGRVCLGKHSLGINLPLSTESPLDPGPPEQRFLRVIMIILEHWFRTSERDDSRRCASVGWKSGSARQTAGPAQESERSRQPQIERKSTRL